MHSWSRQRLGTYTDVAGADHFYFLPVAIEPDPATVEDLDDAENWCVAVAREAPLPDESNTEIVRIDTEHGTPRVDKLWLRPGHPERKQWLDGYTVHDARRHLQRNWREYARRYVVYREGGDIG